MKPSLSGLVFPPPPQYTTPTKSPEARENLNFDSSLESSSLDFYDPSTIFNINAASASSSSDETIIIVSSIPPDDPMAIDSDDKGTETNHGDPPSFHLFKKLPLNIRLKIWSLNLPGPRLVEIIFNDNEQAWFTNAPIIANLSVCRESRLKALNCYPLSFACFDAKAMVPFNFKNDTLFLGRKLKYTHEFFKKHMVGDDLARVEHLMVDAYLNWGKRKMNDRGKGNLGHMSRLVFKSVKEHTVLYSNGVDPLSDWADWRWFPRLRQNRHRYSDTTRSTIRLVAQLKELWPLTHGRIQLPQQDADDHRYGGIAKEVKNEPAIRLWNVPKVYSIGVTREVMDSFDYSRQSCWAALLMDRVIEDIFT